MSRLNVHRADISDEAIADVPAVEVDPRQAAPAVSMTPLLIGVDGLATLLVRSVPSLYRDDAAGRLPAALRIGGSKRWRYADIVLWVDLGCPPRAEFEALRQNRR